MRPQTTDQKPHPCDFSQIDAFLDQPHQINESLESHLESCPSCRVYLDRNAAEPELWQDAQQLLHAGDFDHEAFLLSHATAIREAGTQERRANMNASIKTIVNSLTPSENPHHLGRLGIYEVTGVIGSGGMGVVLKAIDPTLDRTVAIKVMSPYLANHGTARQRFAREAKAAAAVLHPNVIPIFGVAADAELPYLVMAYINGGSLKQRVAVEGPLTTTEILRIGVQAAQGLSAAHQQGLVHRDIKLANIMLENGVERVAITDFGLARAVDDVSLTREGTIAGTPQFMSPEQSRGDSITQSSDVFSLGSVLYYLATGRPPFRAESSYGVMRKICDETPTPICELNPDIPTWLETIIDKMMAKQVADRFESHEVAELLEQCLAHVHQPTAVPLPVSVSQLNQPVKRISWWIPVTFVACLAGVIALVATLIPPKQDHNGQHQKSKQVASMLAKWKEQASGSTEDRQFAKRLVELERQQAGIPGTEKFLASKHRWAEELLPILLAGVNEEKAEFLAKLTAPFDAIGVANADAASGKTTRPVGWDWHAAHVLSLGRTGRLADAFRESDQLIRKIEVNLADPNNEFPTANFFGKDRTLKEILRECRLHRSLIESIHGPPSVGPGNGENRSK